ncbi:MAG TPA: hypothetical protein VFW07_20635 [Parafilimonas sp.]|nr:hypothetical protein [Parafilimonas sp.]
MQFTKNILGLSGIADHRFLSTRHYTKISFRGSYYEVEIMVDNAKIIVRTNKNEFEPGHKIFLRID